jgi:hypothetical protein
MISQRIAQAERTIVIRVTAVRCSTWIACTKIWQIADLLGVVIARLCQARI